MGLVRTISSWYVRATLSTPDVKHHSYRVASHGAQTATISTRVHDGAPPKRQIRYAERSNVKRAPLALPGACGGGFTVYTCVYDSFDRMLSITAVGWHRTVLKQPRHRCCGAITRLRNGKYVTRSAPGTPLHGARERWVHRVYVRV